MSEFAHPLTFDSDGVVLRLLQTRPDEIFERADELFFTHPKLMEAVCYLSDNAYPLNPLNIDETLERRRAFNTGSLISVLAMEADELKAEDITNDKLLTIFAVSVLKLTRPRNLINAGKNSQALIGSTLQDIPSLSAVYDMLCSAYTPEQKSRSNYNLLKQAAGYGFCMLSRGLSSTYRTIQDLQADGTVEPGAIPRSPDA